MARQQWPPSPYDKAYRALMDPTNNIGGLMASPDPVGSSFTNPEARPPPRWINDKSKKQIRATTEPAGGSSSWKRSKSVDKRRKEGIGSENTKKHRTASSDVQPRSRLAEVSQQLLDEEDRDTISETSQVNHWQYPRSYFQADKIQSSNIGTFGNMPQQQKQKDETPPSSIPRAIGPKSNPHQFSPTMHQFDHAVLLAFNKAVNALREVLRTDRDLITFREPLRRVVIEHMVIGYFDSQHICWLNDFKNKYSLDIVVASPVDDINLEDDLLEQRVALFAFFDKSNKKPPGQSSVEWQKVREDWVVRYQKDLLQKWAAGWTSKQVCDEGARGHDASNTTGDRL